VRLVELADVVADEGVIQRQATLAGGGGLMFMLASFLVETRPPIPVEPFSSHGVRRASGCCFATSDARAPPRRRRRSRASRDGRFTPRVRA
jgi:hypothetical protein